MARLQSGRTRRSVLRLATSAGSLAALAALEAGAGLRVSAAPPARRGADAGARSSYNGRSLTPAWGLNTFYAYGLDGFDEGTIAAAARAAVRSGLWQAGYQTFCIDDGWAAMARDAGGSLVEDPARFPSGMAATVANLHALGFAAGIYGDMGTLTCGGRPGTYGFEQQDAQWFAAQGFDFVKMDWCTAEALDAQARYSAMSAALLQTGRPITFSVCNWGRQEPWTWAPTIANSARTTSDISGIYSGDPTPAGPNSYHWACMLKNVDGNQHPEAAGPGYANDPDCLQVGNGFFATDLEERAQLHLWAVMGAPMFLGLDALTVPNATVRMVTHPALRAVNQDPLALQGTRVKSEPGSEVWVKPLADRQSFAVVLLNRLDRASTASVSWKETFQTDQAYVRDLWTGTEVGTARGGLQARLQPHESTLLQVAPQ